MSNLMIYKEWDERIDALRELLRIEFHLHDSTESPWNCVERDCPYFGKPIPRNGCKCFTNKWRAHKGDVKRELGL